MKNNSDGAIAAQSSVPSLSRRMLGATSTLVLTGLLASPAMAQIAPPECSPLPTANGGTLTCDSATDIGGIESSTVEDLTVVITQGTNIVTAGDGIDLRNPATGTVGLTVVADGDITAGGYGISAINGGAGNVSITASGDINAAGVVGIGAINYGVGAQDIDIVSTGSVSGGVFGVIGINSGSGTTNIAVGDTYGGVTGLEARAYGAAGDITLTATGDVEGGYLGVRVNNQGTGSATITAVDVTGAASQGISAVNGANATDLTIVTTGDVVGGTDGISATNNGTGATSITANNVTGQNGAGITATNQFTATDLSVTATGTVTGTTYGVEVLNYGTGVTTVDVADVNGGTSDGIFAGTLGNGISVSSSGTVVGGTNGVRVINVGTGDTTVSVNNTTGGSQEGVFAYNGAGAGDLTLTSTGSAKGVTTGVLAVNYGTGDTTVTAADSSGSNYNGIFVRNGAAAGGVTVDSSGYASGGLRGIFVFAEGTGPVTVNAADATGNALEGIRVLTGAATGDVTVTSTGTITGAGRGFLVENNGTGSTTIDVNNVVGIASDGIFVNNAATTTDLSLSASGDVKGATNGIYALNFGSGATSISVDNVSGAATDGIFAYGGGTDLSVSSTGTISGDRVGLFTVNYGTGDTTISVNDVSGNAYDGILARNGGPSANMSITVTGTATGVGRHGIYAANRGAGTTSVDVANASGGVDGVFLYTGGYASDVSLTSSGTISGNRAGVNVLNAGTGAASVSVTDVTGTTDGILVANSGIFFDPTDFQQDGYTTTPAGTNLSVTATGTVTGGRYGVATLNNGTGDTTITVADVTGTSARGIQAQNMYGAGDLSITSTGTVTGGTSGIYAVNLGTGASSVDVVDVSGGSTDGVFVYNLATATDLSITSTGTVNGGRIGIFAINNGPGVTSVTANNVKGGTLEGIFARSQAGTTSLDITATGDVSGGRNGVIAFNGGDGATTVNVVDVTGSYGRGIYAVNYGNTTDLSVTSTGSVTGSTQGIYALNIGSGATTVAMNDVVGQGAEGIFASNFSGATDLTVSSTGTVTGATTGVDARNSGSGATTVSVNNVTGAAGDGVTVYGGFGGTDVTVTATGDISGANNGLYVDNYGSGDTTVTINNSSGAYEDGAFVFSTGNDLNFTSTGSVEGGRVGAFLINVGSGDLNVSTADTTGGIIGLLARGTYGSGDVNVTSTGTSTGDAFGTLVQNSGTGSTTVTVNDSVSEYGTGVDVSTYYGSGDLSLTSTGTATGETRGVYVYNGGVGSTTVTVANATGNTSDGVYVYGGVTSTDMTVTAVGTATDDSAPAVINNMDSGSSSGSTIVGGTNGIFANNQGTGSTTVTAVDTTGMTGSGIRVESGANTTDVSVSSSGTAKGGANGIFVDADGTGSVTVDAVDTMGGALFGIGVFAAPTTTDVMVSSTGTATGGQIGIRVNSAGTGSVTVDAADAVGINDAGISATGGANSTDVSISASGTVMGGTRGIEAYGNGSGTLTVSANDVVGMSGEGIFAQARGSITSVDVTSTGSVMGDGDAISVVSDTIASTDISVTAVDTMSANGSGIGVTADANDGNVTVVSSGTASGATYGINVVNNGTGTTSVAANNASASSGTGINVVGGVYGGDVNITTAGTVSGSADGIFVDANTGSLTLNVDGAVTGGANGIVSVTESGTTLTVGPNSMVTGGTGLAIDTQSGGASGADDALNIAGTINGDVLTNDGDDVVIFQNGSAMNGRLRLASGDDTVFLLGGLIADARGGSGTDTINFDGTGGVFTNSGDAADGIAGFEIYNFQTGGYTLAGLHQGLVETNFLAGSNVLMGELRSDEVNIAQFSRLNAMGGASIVGDVNNDGILAIVPNGQGVVMIDGDLTLGSTSRLEASVASPANSDLLTVTGDVALNGALNLTQNATGFELGTITLIDAQGAVTGGFSSVNGLLTGGLLLNQQLVTDMAGGNVNLVSSVNDAATIGGLNPNQIALANNLTGQFGAGNLAAPLAGLTRRTVLLGDAGALSNTLNAFSPQITQNSVQTSLLASSDFMYDLLQPKPRHERRNDSEGQFVWAEIDFINYEQETNALANGYDGDGYSLKFGLADLNAGKFRLGVAGALTNLSTVTEEQLGPDGVRTELIQLGAHANYVSGGDGVNFRFDAGASFSNGQQDFTRNVVAPSIGFGTVQETNADIEIYSAMARLNLEGMGGNEWPIQPYVFAGADNYNQDRVDFGAGTAGLLVDKVDGDRTVLGYGAKLSHHFGSGVTFGLQAENQHYGGDTLIGLNTAFQSSSDLNSQFQYFGQEVDNLYRVDGFMQFDASGGWSTVVKAGLGGGDIDSFNASVKVGYNF